MREAFYNFFQGFATWQVVALLFILFILCAQGFEWRRKNLGYENPALDGRFWYSPIEARDFLQKIEKRGRQIYAATELTLDILFPLIYATLFASFIIQVYARENAKNFLLVPLLTAAADVGENITLAILVWLYDGQASPVARVAAILTAVKSVLFVLSLILILIGALVAIWRTSRSPA